MKFFKQQNGHIKIQLLIVNSIIFFHRISEYIPPRPPVPRQVGGAERAVLEFHGQTANIANMLLEQFREVYGEELTQGDMDDSQKAIDERYANFFA